MENYLYLLEVFVDTIMFSSLPKMPKANDLFITGEVGKSIKVEIFTMHHDIVKVGTSNTLQINSGKSNLFSRSPEDLERKLQEFPLKITASIQRKPVGETFLKWEKSFFDLIKGSTENYGVSGPVSMQEKCVLKDHETGVITGDIKISVKLSSFGTHIQTGYQLISPDKDAKKKYLIRGARGETTFECQRFSSGSSADMMPVSPLFTQPKEAVLPIPTPPNMEEETFSWMALFKSTLDPKNSALPEEFSVSIANMFAKSAQQKPIHLYPSTTTLDIVSIVERPEENKFIDLRIRGGSHGFIVELDTLPTAKRSVSAEEMAEEGPLTVKKIEQLLCKNKDCPAAKKFMELGIGPLATTKCLGTLRNDATPPVTYGISQTYGVFDEYGPYGLFSRPKRPEDPFTPPNKNNDWAQACWKPRKKQTKKKNCCKEHPPLRLTGGGVSDYDNIKNPLLECQMMMNQFDEILDKYKKAIGPCGQVTCPFAPNVTGETCRKVCGHDETVKKEETKQYKLGGPCLTTSQAPTPSKFAACGSPRCAYAKYKSGLTDEDAMMELQYLPSPTSGQCGHPKCPNPVEPDLPPIHWDCPDPLPKGRCKNPDCPYLPKEIRCLNAVMNKGPCQNFNCPYAIPEPCQSPNCPFSGKECPYQKQAQEESDSSSSCDNLDCPFASQRTAKQSTGGCSSLPSGPSCPPPAYCPNSMPFCPNTMPFCSPLANPFLQAMLFRYLQAATGGNPDVLKLCFGGAECPYIGEPASMEESMTCKRPPQPQVCRREVVQEVDSSTNCSNPTCPYRPPPPQPPGDVCTNPNCPDARPMRASKGNGGNQEEGFDYVTDYRTEVDNIPCRQGTCQSRGGDLECDECSTCPCDEKPKQNASPYCPMPPCSPRPCQPPPCQPPPCQLPPCQPSPCPPSPCQPSTVCPPPVCGFPATCPFMNPLQAMMAYCLPFSVCDDVNCPYTAKEINNFLQATLGISLPTQQYTSAGKPSGDTNVFATNNETEHIKDTRTELDNRPCTTQSCKSQGGDLECEECPCGEGGGDGKLMANDEENTEHVVDFREDIDYAPCTPKTCHSKGGKLDCNVCPCSEGEGTTGQQRAIKGSRVAKKGKRKKGKYVYSVGDKYPGVQIGHRECILPADNVPKTMGWLWNVFTPCMSLKPRRGWRPGAIGKLIAERIKQHRAAQGLQMLHIKDLRSGRARYGDGYESATSIHVAPKPTLQIKKKDGCYWITMNPLKDPHTLVENESPYMDCTPMQFKIVKNKDNNKAFEVENDYKTCYCGDDDEPVVVESSSDSELDIEFTPPAGIIHPERFKKKRNVVHGGTQYTTADFAAKSDGKGKGKKKGKKGKKDKGKKGKGKKGKKGKK